MRKILLAFSVAIVLFAAGLTWAQPASAAPLLPGGAATTIGEVNIGFAKGLLPGGLQIGGLLAGLPVSRVSTASSFVTVKAPTLNVVKQALALIPGVTYVEDNALMHSLGNPSDTQFNSQYGPQMMGFPAAWGAVGYGSTSITVALIDSGILKTHQDFVGGRVLQGKDIVNNDSDPDDTCGHGTHTAGIVGADTDNGLGIAGAAQVNILEVKALQMTRSLFSSSCSGSTAGIAQAIDYAVAQGANIISMSIGGGASSALQSSVNNALAHHVILVAAAGNDGSANGIDYPGAYSGVVTVGALDTNGARASYSDGGPQLDIMAPGSSVLSTYTGANNATYASLSGTSMATPGVAGALALALGCNNGAFTPEQVTQKLYDTAAPDGNGSPTALSTTYGHGLARADNLVAAVCTGVTPPTNTVPTAAFTTSTSGLTVTANGSTSSDPDPGDSIASYAWTYGDTTSATGATPAPHAYATGGTYTIGLTVTDTHGATASITHPVTVSATNTAPIAAFTASTSGLTVTVNGSSSSDPDSGDSIASYAWTYGDTTSATGATPAPHAYATGGTYTIGLTVTDTHGATASTTTPVTVSTGPPDDGVPVVTSGQVTTIVLSASNANAIFKINNPGGKTQLKVTTTGPACGFFGLGTCPVELDLYTQSGSAPTDSAFVCHAAVKGPAETCTTANPATGFWYLRVKRISGSGSVKLTATLT